MLKFYDIDKDYVKFLQKYDRQVPNIEYSTNNKFVCGIVLHINGQDYYAPVSHMTDKQQTNLQIFDNHKPISTIRFSFMIPATKDVVVEKNFKDISKVDKSYADLLQAEYIYCVKHEDEILNKALSVYKIGCNKNHRLNYTCCNFKLLEEVSVIYKATDEVASGEES